VWPFRHYPCAKRTKKQQLRYINSRKKGGGAAESSGPWVKRRNVGPTRCIQDWGGGRQEKRLAAMREGKSKEVAGRKRRYFRKKDDNFTSTFLHKTGLGPDQMWKVRVEKKNTGM